MDGLQFKCVTVPKGACLKLYIHSFSAAWHSGLHSEPEDLDKRFELPKAIVAQAVFKVLCCELVWDALLSLHSELFTSRIATVEITVTVIFSTSSITIGILPLSKQVLL